VRQFERILFFLLLASIPIQLGKHFWPDFSFVQGIRVDYLSPILYISDVLFIFLFLVSIKRLREKLRKIIILPLFLFAVSSLLIGGIYAYSPLASFFGIIKFLEFFYIAFYIAQTFKRKNIFLLTYIFVLGALVETVICLFQFVSQSSLDGAFYFLGERTFNASTPGIATFEFGDRLLLRPYGTFPHPNVLAFYLLCGFTFLLFSIEFRKGILTFLKVISLFFIALGIFLTFSRVIFLLFFCVMYFWLFVSLPKSYKNKRNLLIFLLSIVMLIFLLLFFQRFEASLIRDSLSRLRLIEMSMVIFFKHMLFGVGINNFYYHEILLQKNVSPTLLQPVHNVYLLWLVESGLAGFVVGFIFLKKTVFRLKSALAAHTLESRFYKMIVILLISAGIIGMFDHYLLTLQQAQLLTSVIFGLAYSLVKVIRIKE
jgi:hypothetical protein